MKTIKSVLLPLLLIGILSISWYFAPPPYFSVPANPDAYQNFQLTIQPPALEPQSQVQSGTPAQLLFLNTRDGRFLFSTLWGNTSTNPASALVGHPYQKLGTYSAFVESTEVYTDKKPPKSVSRLGPDPNQGSTDLDAYVPTPSVSNVPNITVSSANVSSLDPLRITMTSGPIQIAATRRLVPESGVTYAVTIENPSKGTLSCGPMAPTLKMIYDADVLDFVQAMNCYSGSFTNPTPSISTVSPGAIGTITLNLPSMPVTDQRSYFFIFKVKSGVTTSTAIDQLSTATVNFTSSATGVSPECLATYSATVTDQNRLFDSHDPNHKIIIPQDFCPSDSRDLTFRIDFQNDGPGPTLKIEIEDELDFLYNSGISTLDIKNPVVFLGRFNTPVTVTPDVGNRKFRFTINGSLNGTRQVGFGTKFSEASTRGYLEFQLNTDRLTTKPSCNAVCNRARIIFDCNPPLETNTTLSKINCTDCSTCIDSLVYADTIGLLDTIKPIILSSAKTHLKSFLGNSYYCKWYPASGVSNPTDIDAYPTAKKTTTYTLVASSTGMPCRRFVFHRLFRAECDLSVTATATATSSVGCPENWLYTIHAQASSSSASAADLVWADFEPNRIGCQTGSSTWDKINVPPGLYRIAVTDKNTGCSAEYWLDLRTTPIVVDDNPTDCKADLIVSGGAPPYSFNWEWGGQTQTLTGSLLNNLNGKSNVIVTVTDANGCSAVFRPQTGDCTSTGFSGYWLVVLLSITVLGLIFLIFRHR